MAEGAGQQFGPWITRLTVQREQPRSQFRQNETGFTKGPVTTVNGQPALELSQPKRSTHVYVSKSANPEIVQIQGPKGQGYVNFTGYDAPATITTPPASDTLDGAKYGF